MDLTQIAVFIMAAVLYVTVLPRAWRQWALLIGSAVAIYWLQPALNIRWLDYSLPALTLVVTVVSWFVTRKPTGEPDDSRKQKPVPLTRTDWLTLLLLVGVSLVMVLPRYVTVPAWLELTARPPAIEGVLVGLVLAAGIIVTLWRLVRGGNRLLAASMGAMVLIFIVIKTPPLTEALAGFLRIQAGLDASLAAAIDVNWLGFSYVAFRLIHTFRDRQTGLLPDDLGLREYVTYVIFFPAYTAGPIDRAERFIKDFRPLPEMAGRDASRITEASTRIAIGMFKKFVVADSLAIFSLDAISAAQAQSTPALWLLLYAYAFRLYFDFSGYSDIAIGIGLLFGIKLPENFDRPYLKNHIAAFWQSWHITLSNWVRFYVYSPLSRSLLRRKPKPANEVIFLSCNMATMIVIGLWHGVTVPFFIWGAWHGLGLTVHKLWSDRTRKWYRGLKDTPRLKQMWTLFGVFITFHFVVLGWVWFSLPDFETAMMVFVRLFGVGW